MNRFLTRTRLLLSPFLLASLISACGGNRDHDHGPDTHTHDGQEVQTGVAIPADTAGTFIDTTGAFFGDQESLDGRESAGHIHDGAADHTHGEEDSDHDHDER